MLKITAILAALRSVHRTGELSRCISSGKLYLGTMVPKQAKIASSSIFGYHSLIKVKPL